METFRANRIYLVLLMLCQCIVSHTEAYAWLSPASMCESSYEPAPLTEPAPELPTLPNQYSMKIEANILQKSESVEVEEHYDIINQRASVSITRNGTRVVSIFNFRTSQRYDIYPNGTCAARATAIDFLGFIKDKKDKPVLATANEVFKFGASYNMTYVGKEVVRGIRVNHWTSCQNWTRFGAHFQLDYYFSDPDYTTATGMSQVPIRAVLNGSAAQVSRPDLPPHRFLHSYEFTSFRAGPILNDEVFQVPPGIVCSGRTDNKPLPVIPDQLEMSMEVHMGGKRPWEEYLVYDYDHKLVETFTTVAITESMGSNEDKKDDIKLDNDKMVAFTASVVRDHNSGVVYITEMSEGYSKEIRASMDRKVRFGNEDDQSTINSNCYTPQTDPTNHYPQTDPTNHYPQTDPMIHYPQTDPTIHYPQTDPTNHYPQTDPTIHYPQTDPTNHYPQTDPTIHYPQLNMTCSVHKMRLPSANLTMAHGQNLLLAANSNNEFTYQGQATVRNMLVDMWASEHNGVSFELYFLPQSERHHQFRSLVGMFLKNSSALSQPDLPQLAKELFLNEGNEFKEPDSPEPKPRQPFRSSPWSTKSALSGDQLAWGLRLQSMLDLHVPQKEINIFHYSPLHLDTRNFQVSQCYRSDEISHVMLIVLADYYNDVSVNSLGFSNSLRNALAQRASLSLLHISNLKPTPHKLDNQNTEATKVTFDLLGAAPIKDVAQRSLSQAKSDLLKAINYGITFHVQYLTYSRDFMVHKSMYILDYKHPSPADRNASLTDWDQVTVSSVKAGGSSPEYSQGAVAGIAVVMLVVGAVLSGVVVFLVHRFKRPQDVLVSYNKHSDC